MKKPVAFLFAAAISFILFSCNSVTPEKCFGIAALNCNQLYGFAGYEITRDLAAASEKLVNEKTMEMAPMTRAESVKEKLARVEESYQNVKGLPATGDAKEMVEASITLHEFVLPVYKNEYMSLAALYDGKAEAEKIKVAEKNITDKYAARFEALYNNVMKTGTAYAEKNGIEVRTVNPSPKL